MMLLDGSPVGGDQYLPYESFGGMSSEPSSPLDAMLLPPPQQMQMQEPAASHSQSQQRQAPASAKVAAYAPPPTQRGQAAPVMLQQAQQQPPPQSIGMYPMSQQQQQLAASISAWQAQQAALAAQMQEPGYLDSLWDRKRDLFKLCILALVILLAISLHTAVWHYLEAFVDANELTPGRELALRCAYPAVVLVVLWHFKTFLTGASAKSSSSSRA